MDSIEQDLTLDSKQIIVSDEKARLENNPAAVYLAALRLTGRRTMQQALNAMAEMLASGSNAFTLPWQNLRY